MNIGDILLSKKIRLHMLSQFTLDYFQLKILKHIEINLKFDTRIGGFIYKKRNFLEWIDNIKVMIHLKGMMSEKVLFTWSGGKDCAMALYELQRSNNYAISALLTILTEDYDRISMHGVRSTLLEQQAKSLGLPLEKVYITKNASNDEYEAKMREKLTEYQAQGIRSVVFGDIFLEDLRRYRESNLSRVGLKGIFPLWKRDTSELAIAFIDLGFKAIITCVDSEVLGKQFVGRSYDKEFLGELPPEVNPCGENGEFHSFVYGGPIFRKNVAFTKGDIVLRDNRFYFCDLIPFQ